MSEEKFSKGDIIRIAKPDNLINSFARKILDRDAIVVWVGPDKHGQFKNKAKVKFIKRNGRGKEFEEIMDVRDFVMQSRATEAK